MPVYLKKLRLWLGNARLMLACAALRANLPLFAYLAFLTKLRRLKNDLVSGSVSYPSDIKADQELLLTRALDSPKIYRKYSGHDYDRSKIALLCLVQRSIYDGNGENGIWSCLVDSSSTSTYEAVIVDLATPTVLVNQIINEKGISHIFFWGSTEHAERFINYISLLKTLRCLKVSVFLPDPHNYASFDEFLKFSRVADLIYAGSSWMPAIRSTDLGGLIKYRTFAPFINSPEIIPLEQRDISVSFSGLEKIGRLPGLIGLAQLCNKYRIRSSINIMTIPQSVKAGSLSSYYEIIARSVAIINVSIRCRNDSEIFDVINGRHFEALAFKCLLVEFKPQQIKALSIEQYFTEGKHFVSFSNLIELEEIISRLAMRDPTLLEIAEQGHQAYHEAFGQINLIDELVRDFYRS